MTEKIYDKESGIIFEDAGEWLGATIFAYVVYGIWKAIKWLFKGEKNDEHRR